MWLLDTSSLQLREFMGNELEATHRRYAILSHVWGKEEVTFHEMQNQSDEVRMKAGYKKLKAFCDIARQYQYEYAWLDTACIDRRSSAELSENINSMYRYYGEADLCIIYLEDVASDARASEISSSRWFKRGWTLQELVAPRERRFFASNWAEIKGQAKHADPLTISAAQTGIPVEVLRHERPIDNCCVAERMSWAAGRQTTKPEDRAYSLIGIFNVNISVLYGEGLRNAFTRLLSEIMKLSFDQSLFAWRTSREGDEGGLLPQSPDDFKDSPAFGLRRPRRMFAPFVQTNIGISIRPQVYSTDAHKSKDDLETLDEIQAALQLDVRTESGWMIPTVRLRRVHVVHCWADGKEQTAWRRIECGKLGLLKRGQLHGHRYEDLIVLEAEQHQLLQISSKAFLSRREERDWGEDPHAKLPPAWHWHKDG